MFDMIFRLIKYQQNQFLYVNLYHQNNDTYNFEYQFLLVHFYYPNLYVTFYTDIHIRKLVDTICYFQEK